MTAFGVTPTGFNRKLFSDVQSGIFGYWRTKISKYLQLTEKTGLGNVGNGAADQLAQAWEAAEGAYYANDPDNADEASFEAICQITGTYRRDAAQGTWPASCNLAAGKTYAPGALVGNVQGQATNRWSNRDAVTSSIAGNYPVVFQSEQASSAAIGQAGTLVIAQPIDGWLGVSTARDATAGQDVESIEELAQRRVTELLGSGSGPLAAIVARVSKVPGVISVRGAENKSRSYDLVNNLLPNSYRIVVWDGATPQAQDNDIAAAIAAAGSASIPSLGLSSGVSPNGETFNFARASQVEIYVSCTVAGTASLADIQAAIIAKGESLTSGNNIVAEKIRAAITDTTGVTDLISFTIGTVPSPLAAANIPIPATSIGLFDRGRIVVTFA